MTTRKTRRNPRILIVTPEITYLPSGMGNMANRMGAKAGGLADVSAALVSSLFDLGADVHVALPHYRRMFHVDVGRLINRELKVYLSKLPHSRVHLAEDRVFYYRDHVYSSYDDENPRLASVFQREVINHIIPRVNPDLIHCNDWMTGMVPGYARRLGIPSLFTIHNIHTQEVTLESVEETGIDAAEFWPYLYYKRPPESYEESRSHNKIDLLCSGIFASHFINTVSPTFLDEIVNGYHHFVPDHLRAEIINKKQSNCAAGILNAPDGVYNPVDDEYITHHYTADTHVAGKLKNKRELQAKLNLFEADTAPILFWPSRLDPVQKGCQLLAEIMFDVVSRHWASGLQMVMVANGTHQRHFRDIVRHHDFHSRVAVVDFDEDLSHLGFAGADFTLMPSSFEPCGLPQMISQFYGNLPIAHDTGGLHDTVEHLNVAKETGNGFVFETYDSGGLSWAIDRAIDFYKLPVEVKERNIRRIMKESRERFDLSVCAKRYFDIYESMLHRPLVREF